MTAGATAVHAETPSLSKARRALVILTLMVAGEGVFLLPFILARIFRPALLDVLGLTNVQLGAALSIYGVLALVSYVPGGLLADRFPARRLMVIALVTTALGGFVLANLPSHGALKLLYAFWGVTTILLFWAAKIRATREWGGSTGQGRAFGLLEGGRGVLSACLASISVVIFASLLPTDVASASLAQRSAALCRIIWIFTGIVASLAVMVWFAIPESAPVRDKGSMTWTGVRAAVSMPALWLQAILMVCSYVFNKSTDIYSLYARDAFGYDDVAAAQITTIAFWARPFAAVGAGFLADRISPSRMMLLSFCVMLAGSLTIASGVLRSAGHWMLVLTVAGTSAGLFATRGVFFALFHEARVPMAITGSAVGVVSLIGYTPDIFMPALLGYLLDRSPGAVGHQHVFGVLAMFATVGLLTALAFQRVTRKNAD